MSAGKLDKMATYLLGDIHGCFNTLERLLRQIDYRENRDRLICVGDLVNGGPESARVVRWAATGRLETVLGNHDLHLLAVAAGFRKLRRKDTFIDLLNAPDASSLIEWLRHRPLMILEPHAAIVHAGFLPAWTLEKARALAGEVERILRGERWRPLFHGMYGNIPDRWEDRLAGDDRLRMIINVMTRMRALTADGCLDLNFKGPPEEVQDGRIPWYAAESREWERKETPIFCGHWAALGRRRLGIVHALDSGCVWGGELTAARLEDGEVFAAKSELAADS